MLVVGVVHYDHSAGSDQPLGLGHVLEQQLSAGVDEYQVVGVVGQAREHVLCALIDNAGAGRGDA
ncbi:hypothetical protein D1872_330620 [compost metagenome]